VNCYLFDRGALSFTKYKTHQYLKLLVRIYCLSL